MRPESSARSIQRLKRELSSSERLLPMSDLVSLYDNVLEGKLEDLAHLNIESDEATVAVRNLKTLSECRPPDPKPEPEVAPEPSTVLEKLKANLAGVWDNETTRVLIKAGGGFAGVALVTWATVRRDHVYTRDALSQANQRIG